MDYYNINKATVIFTADGTTYLRGSFDKAFRKLDGFKPMEFGETYDSEPEPLTRAIKGVEVGGTSFHLRNQEYVIEIQIVDLESGEKAVIYEIEKINTRVSVRIDTVPAEKATEEAIRETLSNIYRELTLESYAHYEKSPAIDEIEVPEAITKGKILY